MTAPSTETDVVVLGLGIHGAAASLELARRGLSVIGVEQFAPGHSRGSSHGATRMIRRAYPNAVWNELVSRAYDGWERWAEIAGESFYTATTGLYAHRGSGTMQGGRSRPVGSAEVAELMPSVSFPQGYEAVFDLDAGVLKAEKALAFAHRAAQEHGAELRFGERVEAWSTDGGGVTVTTSGGSIRASRLVLAGGAWAPKLMPRYAEQFEVWRIVTLSARPGQEVGQPPQLGSFSVDLPEGLVFGVPAIGQAGAKVGIDAGLVWDPEVPVAEPTQAEVSRLAALFESFVPGIDLTGAEAVACLYTMTPDKRFVVGALPGEPGVIAAAACSGHGFKFGPAIGAAVADLVQGVPRPDLDFVSPERWEAA
ncbi:FAD-dependent oxidoreductase [Salinibacterium sp. SYSU T00001]|uniref:FAD-dependent oxidoreductase n=1 Tax=Homoserinimonas sedimenticola TaxID=2986805 RepID=UPI0022360FCC|nr:FAD-dependent oxidoreductase [Salinibacterium sedimenticola]MCW4385075.1 FAD-dependent oxidoreductase [Salinibacterium sedimenticola]